MLLSLLLVAVAVGLSNFAAAIGIGISGVDAGVRLRVGIVFGLFEATMPLIGLIFGHQLAGSLGSSSPYIGGGLLIATGGYTVLQARRQKEHASVFSGTNGLIVAGAALSVDNLVVGFAIGAHKAPVILSAVVIGIVSVCMSLAGLELGDRLGAAIEDWSEEIGGAVLTLVGIAIASGVL